MNNTKFKRRINQLVGRVFIGSVVLMMSSMTVQATPVTGDIVVNQVTLPFNEDSGYPVSEAGRTHVPIRMMADALGYQTAWDGETQMATISDGGITVELKVDSPWARVNGEEVIIDKREAWQGVGATATIRNGRVYVPLRFVTENLGCEVTFASGVTYIAKEQTSNKPIKPWDYQKQLGRGMDVDWSKTQLGKTSYSIQMVKDFKKQGISHVRIRIKDAADEQLFTALDQQIKDCLENGLIPIIAYQADEFKNDPSEKQIEKVVQWWGTVAKRYQDQSHLLAFDLLIEATDALNSQPEKLNQIYERVVSEIRKTNPTRIIMISPRLRSDAAYLNELEIPLAHNGYLMAEWHFYAAGPSKTNERKLWTTGTEKEKALIQEKIDLALAWQKKTGIPTWVGAWMPGNYNDGNEYNISEQVVFASYMTQQLKKAGIPFAVNSDTKFYNAMENKWIKDMEPVRECIFGKK